MAKEKQAEQKTPKRFYEPECSPIVGVFKWQVDEDGHHLFVQVGEKNFDDEIQLWKDQTDIKILVDKIQAGDAETIARLSQPVTYGDVNNYPKEYHVAAGNMALHQLYENQPDSVKDQFPTFEKFEKYFLSLTDAMVAQMFAPKEPANPAPEVTGNE